MVKLQQKERLDKLLSNLGYCSRQSVKGLLREERIKRRNEDKLRFDDHVSSEEISFDGEQLDPRSLVLMLNKPSGYSCTFSSDEGETVYDLLPPRYSHRNPKLSCVGRLDRDTTGILLLTDDGELLHRIVSPSHHVPKIYEAKLSRPLKGGEAELFRSGTIILEEETEPLKPVELEVISSTHVRITMTEGKYHQVRRMFGAVGNFVEALTRVRIGALELGEMEEGQYCILDEDKISRIWAASANASAR